MGLFRNIFRGTAPEINEPKITFGRYSDAYKTDSKYDAWDQSLEKFDQGKFHESYRLFFEYLRDDNQLNVLTREEDGVLYFELLQGSKKVVGTINDKLIKAEAKIATADKLNVGFLRRMIEQNFNLKYGRYALDDQDNPTLVFDSYLLDGSPYKLYYALKEIAVNADKHDDLLVAEFDMLHSVNVGHTKPVSEEEKEVKYAYLKENIEERLTKVDSGQFKSDQLGGGIGYFLLDLCYRIDYLIRPEGKTMEALERIHRQYFEPQNNESHAKNAQIQKELKKLLAIPKEVVTSGFYTTPATFGITNPRDHDQLVSFIEGELHNMDWYAKNRFEEIALAIPGYIVGYCLFNYALARPTKELLHLYYYIFEPNLFKDLGFSKQFITEDPLEFDRKMIKRKFNEIQGKYKETFTKFNPQINKLDYSSKHDFARSYLLMIKDLDLTKFSDTVS